MEEPAQRDSANCEQTDTRPYSRERAYQPGEPEKSSKGKKGVIKFGRGECLFRREGMVGPGRRRDGMKKPPPDKSEAAL